MSNRRQTMGVILKGELARKPLVSVNTITCQKVMQITEEGGIFAEIGLR